MPLGYLLQGSHRLDPVVDLTLQFFSFSVGASLRACPLPLRSSFAPIRFSLLFRSKLFETVYLSQMFATHPSPFASTVPQGMCTSDARHAV